MRLSELARVVGSSTPDLPDLEITGATHASGWVQPGDAFVAIRGGNRDGHDFIADAASRGAATVLGETPPPDCPLPYLVVPDARRALAQASAALRQYPAERLHVVGVTGTDGKTTTSLMIRHLLRSAGLATGLISTLGYELPDGQMRQPPEHFTTPEAPQVQQILADILAAGGKAAVVEASSHALALERVGAILFDVGVWTQITSEHLDFHGDLEQYFAAKRTLIQRSNHAILNADDTACHALRGLAPTETRYSEGSPAPAPAGYQEPGPAEWRASNVREEPTRLCFDVASPLGEFAVEVPLMGRFNVANALAAMAAAAHLGATVEQLTSGLATFTGVPGRMQLVPSEAGEPRVIVDFAHTPGSLEKALRALRETTIGRLFVLIGSSGGQRDTTKRAPLGEVATRLADSAVFTEDDPRDTPIEEILAQMERGAREAGAQNYRSIADRSQAVRAIIAEAGADDTVLLAGKGPEDFILRAQRDPWDEVAEAQAALSARGPSASTG